MEGEENFQRRASKHMCKMQLSVFATSRLHELRESGFSTRDTLKHNSYRRIGLLYVQYMYVLLSAIFIGYGNANPIT